MSKLTCFFRVVLLSLFVFANGNVFAVNGRVLAEKTAVELQSIPIQGVISDKLGPIVGATVLIQGTTSIGSTSGNDGSFSFDAPVGAVVEVSFIGYAPTTFTVVKGRSVYNVTLEETALKINEVVVTALGIKRDQKAIGYAVSELKGEDIASVNVVNPVAALQGKVAGVSIRGSAGGVMSSSSIKIRGMSTLSGENQPIFVMDGVVIEGGRSGSGDEGTNDYGNILKNLNSDDFENMTVLKGAAATALYGSRGINGAVVITTKSGKSGKNFGISVSQVTGIDVAYRTPEFQTEFGSGLYPGDIHYANRPDGSVNRWDNTTPYYEKVNGRFIPSLRSGAYEASGYGAKYSDVAKLNDGKIVDYDGEVVDYKLYGDNLKQIQNVGVNTSTNVSISGGGEKTTFYLSDTYSYRKGVMPGNTFEKNSTLVKGSYQISKKLRIEASINYVTSKGTNPPFTAGSLFWDGQIPHDYNVSKFKDKWETSHGGKPQANYGDKYGAVPGMGYWFKLNTLKTTQRENMITPIVKLNYQVTDWLDVVGEVNMNYYNINKETRERGEGYQMEGGTYSLGYDEQIRRSAKASLNFHKKFGDFTTSLFVGGEWYRNRGSYLNSRTDGGLIVPGQYFLANSKNPLKTEGGLKDYKNIYSVYFLASASWKDQLFLDVTGRNDWSTALVYSNGTGNNSYFYPSVSGSWLFAESFNVPDWFTYGKLRVSWAQVGNDTSPYSINNIYTVGSELLQGNGNGYLNDYAKRLVDPSLRPERKNSFEVGADIRFLKNRIGLDVTYYKENTRDQIVELPASSESDVSTQLINAGNIQNQGWEIALNTTPVKTKNFEWDVNLIYTRNRNTIISLHPDLGDYKSFGDDYGSGGIKTVAYIGGYYGDILTTNLPKTNDKGQKLLLWNDGNRGAYYPRSGKEVKIGNLNPKFEGSISTSFRFYGVEISALIDARIGGFMVNYDSRYLHRSGYAKSTLPYRDAERGGITYTSKYSDSKDIVFTDGMIPEGIFQDGTTVTTPDGKQQLVGGLSYKEAYDRGYIEPTHAGYYHYRTGSWSTGWVDPSWTTENAKYVALRQVSISYTFPAKVTQKLRLSNLNISLDGHNLCYLYNNLPNKINPETTGSGALSSNTLALMPYVATYSLAIRFNL